MVKWCFTVIQVEPTKESRNKFTWELNINKDDISFRGLRRLNICVGRTDYPSGREHGYTSTPYIGKNKCQMD